MSAIKINKAITIQEPWASLILTSGKDVENRSWFLDRQYWNQWIAIHTSKKLDFATAARFGIYPKTEGLGAIVGAVKFTDCHRNWQCSDWAVYGQYHWIIDRHKIVLNTPIPARGQLKLWNIDLSLEESDYRLQIDLEKKYGYSTIQRSC